MKYHASIVAVGSAIGILALSTALNGFAYDTMGKTLAAFDDESVAEQWRSVNDNVMGGVSEGGFRITEEKTMVFSGNLSLKNRGGFASIRTREADLNMGGYGRIAIRLKGDGRTYYVNLMTSSRSAASSYRAPVGTKKDTWQEVSIDLADFQYTSFGRIAAGAPPVKSDAVRSLGITLADKKAGPFRLEVAWIRAEKGTGGANATHVAGTETSARVGNIVETAVAAGSFKTLVAAVKAAGLVEALTGPGPFTVFAPTDEAFEKLPKGTVESLLKAENRTKLQAILKYHVVAGEISLGALRSKTLQGGQLDIRPGGDIRVDEAKVLQADVRASNGIVHAIDRVLLPELPEETPGSGAMGVIELAIRRGVPLFNDDKPEACAAIYEVAVKSLLEGYSAVLDGGSREGLRRALDGIGKEHSAIRKAWILRYALDEVYRSLRDRD